MTMKRTAAAVLITASLALAGCGGAAGGSEGSGEAAADGPVRIGYFADVPNSFTAASVAAVESVVAADGNAEVSVVQAGGDASRQFNQLQDAISSQRFDALLVVPLNSGGLAPIAQQAEAAGIAVVAVNQPIGPRLDTADPQLDGVGGSVLLPSATSAEYFAEMTAAACADIDPCKVGYIGASGSTVFDTASLDELKALSEQNPSIQVVSEGGAMFQRDPANGLTQDFLQKDPDLQVIVALGDQPAVGARIAVEAAGKGDQVKIIGFGASKTGVDAVRSGTMYGTVVKLPATEGETAATMALQLARGEQPSPAGVVPSVPGGLPNYISQDNVDEFADFTAEWDG